MLKFNLLPGQALAAIGCLPLIPVLEMPVAMSCNFNLSASPRTRMRDTDRTEIRLCLCVSLALTLILPTIDIDHVFNLSKFLALCTSVSVRHCVWHLRDQS